MELNLTPELEAKLTHRAAQQGLNPGDLVQDALARYFDEEARLVEAVRRGEDALDRGEYLTHEHAARAGGGCDGAHRIVRLYARLGSGDPKQDG